jgi:hypothetical protein
MKKIIILFFTLCLFACSEETKKANEPVVNPDEPVVPVEEVISDKDIVASTYNTHFLLEDFTSASCGWCPYMMDVIETLHGNETFIPIAVQCTFAGDDSFVTPHARKLMTKSNVRGFPTLVINRDKKLGNAEDEINDFSTLEDKTSDIGIIVKLIKAEGVSQVHIGLSFLKDFADVKIMIYSIQNKLIVDQHNYLTGDSRFKDSRFYDLPSVIKDFEINHVLRDIHTDLFGDAVAADKTVKDALFVTQFDIADEDLPTENGELVIIVSAEDEIINSRKITLEY